VGQYCYFKSGSCIYFVGISIACEVGSQYPSLLNSDAGSAHISLVCSQVREAVRDSRDSVLCLTPLLPHVSEHLLVSWDGSPIPKGHVRTFVAEGGARPIHLAPLPPYASDLHPGEGVWHQWKNGARRNLCCLNRAHLRRELGLALKRLRRKPHVLTACVAQAGLSGETYVLHATVCKNLRLPHLHGCFRQRLRAHQLSYRLIHLPAHTALV
jgi:hypothetical protein